MLAHAHQDELDAGPHKRGPGAERLCAATREVRPVEEMLRFVVGPDGVVPDIKRKLPGRGLWITADRATLEQAVARNVFARGFKRDVKVTPELVDLTDRLLLNAALDALAVAGKAGQVVAGFAKVEAAIEGEEIVGIVHAAEAAADGVGKLRGALRRGDHDDKLPIITTFSSAQLDLALGRSNVVHAALLAGPANDTFLTRLARLGRFRSGKADQGGQGLDGTDRIRN
jgi:predicted RNA-binding protein YlxR (DUF448 family)